MSVSLFMLISAVKSVSLFLYWKLFIIPLFVFCGVLIKQPKKFLTHDAGAVDCPVRFDQRCSCHVTHRNADVVCCDSWRDCVGGDDYPQCRDPY